MDQSSFLQAMRLLDESIDVPDQTAVINLTANDAPPPYTPSEQEGPTASSSDTSFDLGTPELRIYESKDALLHAMYAHGRQHGYDVARKKPRKNAAGEQTSFLLKCKRHGSLDNYRRLTAEDRSRPHRTTKKTGCTFRLIASAVDGGGWQLRRGISTLHNHPSDPIHNLPGHRCRDLLPREPEVVNLIETGTAVRAVIAYLNAPAEESPPPVVTLQDLYNLRYKAQQSKLTADFPTTTSYAIHMLQNSNYHLNYRLDSDGQIIHLLLINPKSLEAYITHAPDVLMFDCTYRTNQYNLPLLNVVGLTGSNHTVTLGVALLSGEAAADFQPVIRSIKELLHEHDCKPSALITDRQLALTNVLDQQFPEVPHLLCIWHINKDVLASARQKLPAGSRIRIEGSNEHEDSPDTLAFMQAFHKAVESPTEADFGVNQRIIDSQYPTMKHYLESTWWPYRTRFVKAWIDQYRHYGQTATSRLEGAHHSLKCFLGSTRNNLLSMSMKFDQFVFSQLNTVHHLINRSSTTPFSLRGPFWQSCILVIHHYALQLAKKEHVKALRMKNDPSSRYLCTGRTFRTMGIPCSHRLLAVLEHNGVLLPTEFDAHWWIDRSKHSTYDTPRVREPLTRARRRDHRARGEQAPHSRGHGQDSTRRDYLWAKKVDPAVSTPATSRIEAARRAREATATQTATRATGEGTSAATATGEGTSTAAATGEGTSTAAATGEGTSAAAAIGEGTPAAAATGDRPPAKRPRKSRAKKKADPPATPEISAVLQRMVAFLDRQESSNSPSTAPPAPSSAPAVPTAPPAPSSASAVPTAPPAAAPAQPVQYVQPIQYVQYVQPAEQPHLAAQAPIEHAEHAENSGVPYRTAAEASTYVPAVNFRRSYMFGGPRTDIW